MKTLLKFSSVVNRFNYWMIIGGGFILGIFALVITFDVVMRYVFNAPVTGVKQIGEYALVWLCFVSVGWIRITNKHVAVTLMQSWIFNKTKRRKRISDLSIEIVCLFYTLFLLLLSVSEVWEEYYGGAIVTGELGGAPAYLVNLCIPIGFLSLTIISILNVAMVALGIEQQGRLSIEREEDWKP